jgi:hypothetical protein
MDFGCLKCLCACFNAKHNMLFPKYESVGASVLLRDSRAHFLVFVYLVYQHMSHDESLMMYLLTNGLSKLDRYQ